MPSDKNENRIARLEIAVGEHKNAVEFLSGCADRLGGRLNSAESDLHDRLNSTNRAIDAINARLDEEVLVRLDAQGRLMAQAIVEGKRRLSDLEQPEGEALSQRASGKSPYPDRYYPTRNGWVHERRSGVGRRTQSSNRRIRAMDRRGR
jgi:hypothetical protein